MKTKSKQSPQKTSNPPDSRWFELLPLGLFLAMLGYFIWGVGQGWTNTITEHHDFRQTQCALSTYYMVKEPFKFAYETPIFGPPWAIPLEFPLYEWATAGLVRIVSTPLEQTGRFVSALFYLLTLLPVYSILGSLRVARPHRLAVLAILLASPFYTFWSRTFMIETTALFFNVSYLALALRALDRPSRRMLLLGTAVGMLAAMVKATTWPAFCMGILLFAARPWLKLPFCRPDTSTAIRLGLRLAILVGIPLIAGVTWTHYSDFVKVQNPLGYVVSSAGAATWNFGTLDQRFSLDTWVTILGRIPTLFTPDELFWVGLLLALCVVWPLTRRRWKEALACCFLYLLSPLLFINLHLVHDYYMCANGIFLLVAAGFFLVGLLETPGWRVAALAVLPLLLLAGIYEHQTAYLPLQRVNRTDFLPLAHQIRDKTDPDAINIYAGFHIKALLPYYTERRALMIPGGDNVTDEAVRKALLNLRGQKIGFVLITHQDRFPPERLLEYMKEFDLKPQGVYTLPFAP